MLSRRFKEWGPDRNVSQLLLIQEKRTSYEQVRVENM
jgi:hypothetical protein